MIATVIHNVKVVTPTGMSDSFVTIDHNGFISEVSNGKPSATLLSKADEIVDGHGALLMPGAIDAHVHFREPGLTHKATIASESRAAVSGGVTSFVDMPNTKPQTVTMADINAKADIAAHDSLANYSFYIGATNDNLKEILNADYSKVAGIKLFMGSSTGNMLVDSQNALERLFKAAPALITVHAEDEETIKAAREEILSEFGQDPPIRLHTRMRSTEACYKASAHAVALAHKYNSRLHIAHLTTAAELTLLESADKPLEEKLITAEVSPHHLLFTTDDYERLGSRIKMNPAIKTAADRDALRQAISCNLIDIIATDHAPHLLEEKEGSLFKAVSGAPMVQFSLPATLSLFEPTKVAEIMADKPARLFKIERRGRIEPGYYADLALVKKIDDGYTISDADVLSPCGWTPLTGHRLYHKVITTWVNGKKVFDHGSFNESHRGKPLKFNL